MQKWPKLQMLFGKVGLKVLLGLCFGLMLGCTSSVKVQAATSIPDNLPMLSGLSTPTGYVKQGKQWVPVTLAEPRAITAQTKVTTKGPDLPDIMYYYVLPKITYRLTDKSHQGTVYVAAPVLTKQVELDFYGGQTAVTPTITLDGQTPADPGATAKALDILAQGRLRIQALYQDNEHQYLAFRLNNQVYLINEAAVSAQSAMGIYNISGRLTTNQINVRTYEDAALTDYTGHYIQKAKARLTVDKVALTVDDSILSYHIEDDNQVGGDTWVSAKSVTFVADHLTLRKQKGTFTPMTETVVYQDRATTKATDQTLMADKAQTYQTVVYSQDSNAVVAYGLKTGYVNASDTVITQATGVIVEALPANTAGYTDHQPATIYSDPDLTVDTGLRLDDENDTWAILKVAKTKKGLIKAYQVGDDEWIQTKDLKRTKQQNGVIHLESNTSLYTIDGLKKTRTHISGAYPTAAVGYINGQQCVKLRAHKLWVPVSQGTYYQI